MFEGLVKNWELPQKEPYSKALELTFPDRKIEFSYVEVNAVVDSLSESAKAEYQKDNETTSLELATLLYYLRYPYEEDDEN